LAVVPVGVHPGADDLMGRALNRIGRTRRIAHHSPLVGGGIADEALVGAPAHDGDDSRRIGLAGAAAWKRRATDGLGVEWPEVVAVVDRVARGVQTVPARKAPEALLARLEEVDGLVGRDPQVLRLVGGDA